MESNIKSILNYIQISKKRRKQKKKVRKVFPKDRRKVSKGHSK